MANTLQTPSTTPTAAAQRSVVFSLKAPQAKNVLLAGDFTDWEQHARPLKKNGGEVWKTQVNVPMGRHHYKFIVDGEWQTDPTCKECEANGFGTTNNVIEIK